MFPIVLADPCGGPKQWVDVHIERRGQQAIGWFKVEKKSETSYASKLLGEHADWPAHEAAELPYLQAEENRLLYVAATRARQLLIVSRHVPQKGTAAWGVLNNFMASAKELTVPATVSAVTPKPASFSARAQADGRAARSSTEDVVTPPSWSITTVTAEAKHIARMAGPAEPVVVDDATRVVAQDTPSHRADAGMAWGTLIHGLLEHAMRHHQASREDLKRLGTWLTVEQPELRQVIDQAVATVQAVATAGFWPDAQSGEHSVEVPFSVAVGERALSAGVIDLLYQAHDDTWNIVDYKTDSALDDAARSIYELQLDAYRRALRACSLRNVSAGLRQVRTDGEYSSGREP